MEKNDLVLMGCPVGPRTETSAMDPLWFRHIPTISKTEFRGLCQSCWLPISIFFCLLTEEGMLGFIYSGPPHVINETREVETF